MLKRYILIAIVLVLAVTSASPQQACCSLTISGTGAAVQISTSSTPVHWIQIVAPTGNMSTSYWSIGNTSTANGGILPAGAGQFLPPKSQGGYDLAGVYVYAAMGDTLRIAWDPF